ncbi:MAG: general secretion pathway protein GspK, partial [Bdellovibrio sp.]|nr:general secretion pathway protein GspK [Bdellovibrio sp.]
TDEVVGEIIKRRETESEGGPFKCDQSGGSSDFWNFVQSRGVRVMGNPEDIPMTCDTVMNFKIRSTGEFAGATREITAIVMDLNRTATKVKSYVDKEKQDQGSKSDQKQKQQQKKDPLPKGPPRIVYWNER